MPVWSFVVFMTGEYIVGVAGTLGHNFRRVDLSFFLRERVITEFVTSHIHVG